MSGITVHVASRRVYDEDHHTWVTTPEATLKMEHSLISISKWESKWKKPYLTKLPQFEKTNEEYLDYLKCMTIGEVPPDIVYLSIAEEDLIRIHDYIEDPQTATTICDLKPDDPNSQEYETSETLYYYMFKLGIPKECERWHINRLMALLKIYDTKDNPDNKMTEQEALMYQKKLIAQRRAEQAARHQ